MLEKVELMVHTDLLPTDAYQEDAAVAISSQLRSE